MAANLLVHASTLLPVAELACMLPIRYQGPEVAAQATAVQTRFLAASVTLHPCTAKEEDEVSSAGPQGQAASASGRDRDVHITQVRLLLLHASKGTLQ